MSKETDDFQGLPEDRNDEYALLYLHDEADEADDEEANPVGPCDEDDEYAGRYEDEDFNC